ncbi:hypothetical protein BU14_0779s0004 [Porphyra umbilicalis]|uniref:Uncharacterized protein n=1 Tax=Porphyra umbilicalis TaxID=2786 RepID=A0A1X6NPA5_PORUM|nr:hypothetical protein BU14_0779s0004 [Porphyra umbilicalis]|eukprot:OSX70360.1 hypothetical protein BU14_0779s0004 [Porphyra umbilicalis]
MSCRRGGVGGLWGCGGGHAAGVWAPRRRALGRRRLAATARRRWRPRRLPPSWGPPRVAGLPAPPNAPPHASPPPPLHGGRSARGGVADALISNKGAGRRILPWAVLPRRVCFSCLAACSPHTGAPPHRSQPVVEHPPQPHTRPLPAARHEGRPPAPAPPLQPTLAVAGRGGLKRPHPHVAPRVGAARRRARGARRPPVGVPAHEHPPAIVGQPEAGAPLRAVKDARHPWGGAAAAAAAGRGGRRLDRRPVCVGKRLFQPTLAPPAGGGAAGAPHPRVAAARARARAAARDAREGGEGVPTVQQQPVIVGGGGLDPGGARGGEVAAPAARRRRQRRRRRPHHRPHPRVA